MMFLLLTIFAKDLSEQKFLDFQTKKHDLNYQLNVAYTSVLSYCCEKVIVAVHVSKFPKCK